MDDETGWWQQDFTQEDEMSSWLQFPFDDLQGDIESHIIYSHPTVPHHETTRSGETTEEFFRPPISPHSPYTPFVPYRPPSELDQPQFLLSPFTSSIAAAGPSTICSTDVEGIAAAAPKLHSFLNYCWVPKAIVEQKSILTPAAAGMSVQLSGWNVGGPSGVASTSSKARKDFTTVCEPMVMASPDASTSSGSIKGTTSPVPHKLILSKAEGKRREREFHDNDCLNDDDDDLRIGDVQKKSRKTTTLNRGRAAEVHNLSERRRRDKISTKLRTLQELIPNSNKDISSILDEAITYMKSLQLQVKILNMGSGGIVPRMYPGTQEQYIAAAMGIGMAIIGMGMDMGAMNQPMMPYPTTQPGVAAPSFHMPPFPMQPVPVPPITARTPPESDSLPMQPRLANPSVVQQPQLPTRSFFQSRAVVRPSTTVPSSTVDALNPEKQKTG